MTKNDELKLEHIGILGMHWGKHKGGKSSGTPKKTKISTKDLDVYKKRGKVRVARIMSKLEKNPYITVKQAARRERGGTIAKRALMIIGGINVASAATGLVMGGAYLLS
jgi:hypothetical protein